MNVGNGMKNILSGQEEKSEIPRSRTFLDMAGVALVVVALLVVFALSQRIGGRGWDEDFDYLGISQQLDVVLRFLGGDAGANFREISRDYAYYGIIAVWPAYAAERLANYYGVVDTFPFYTLGLHTVTFACYLLTLLTTYCILLRATGSRAAARIGTGLLALYPLWLGFSFFDHKDIPTAFAFTLALYGGVGLLQSGDEPRARRFFTLVLALATVFIAGLKIPAMVLVVPSWIAAFYVFARGRHFKAALGLVAVTLVGVALVTPVAWSDPFNFVIESFKLMSRHAWDGCTLVAGTKMCTHADDWSALSYMVTWYVAQVPFVIGLGAGLAILVAPWRGRVQVLFAVSVILPLILISFRNSTLYDGLRHLLFTMPAMFILASLFWFDIWRQTRTVAIPVVAAVLAALFVWDNVALFPYNYVYFNLPTRMFANERNNFTDLWGFSIKEAARLPVVNDPSLPVVGYPKHLVEPYLLETHPMLIWPREMDKKLPKGSEYIIVSYERWASVPDGCSETQFITRRLPMGQEMKMSFAARCTVR